MLASDEARHELPFDRALVLTVDATRLTAADSDALADGDSDVLRRRVLLVVDNGAVTGVRFADGEELRAAVTMTPCSPKVTLAHPPGSRSHHRHAHRGAHRSKLTTVMQYYRYSVRL